MSRYLKCDCRWCGQHIEFPTETIGQNIPCPACDQITALHNPNSKTITIGAGVILGTFFAIIAGACILYGLIFDKGDVGYTPQYTHDAGVQHWEETLRNEDQKINGMKTETDEEIHHDAEMLQHEQEEGITPAGMMQRELDGKHDQ